MMNTVDARGLPDPLVPKYLLIPPALLVTARKLLESEKVAGSANNDKNIVRDYSIKIIVNPYLTDSTAWFLLTEKDYHQLLFFWRIRPEDGAFNDEHTTDAIYYVRARFSYGWVDARGVYGSYGS